LGVSKTTCLEILVKRLTRKNQLELENDSTRETTKEEAGVKA
jgi:hypothetical protein